MFAREILARQSICKRRNICPTHFSMAFSCSWLTGTSVMLPFWLTTPLTMVGTALPTMVPSSVLLLLIFLESVAVFALSFTFVHLAFTKFHSSILNSRFSL